MLRSLVTLVVCGSFLTISHAEEPEDIGTKLDGAWRMVAYKPAGKDEYVPFPEGSEHTKLVAGGRFVWTTVRDGKVTRAGGGRARVRDDQYIEQIDSVLSDQDRWMVGKTGTFKWRLDGGKLYVEGTIEADRGQSRIAEVWERAK